jgi:hypothetical protein
VLVLVLAVAGAVLIILTLRCPRSVCGAVGRDFSSLAGERDFWREYLNEEWIAKHSEDGGFLEDFHLDAKEGNFGISKQIDDELCAIAKTSKNFVLVVRLNYENDIVQIVSLAENRNWQVHRWERRETAEWKRSVSTVSEVKEDILVGLADGDVYVDISDFAYDEDTVYVFLRYGGKVRRFGVYNPQYKHASSSDQDDNRRDKAKKDPVAAALVSLFLMLGIGDEPW